MENVNIRRKIILSIISIIVVTSIVAIVFFCIKNKDEVVENNVTVSYVVSNAINKDKFNSITIKQNDIIEEQIEFPYVSNKYFEGWYLDANFENKANFPIVAYNNIILYAKYIDGNLPKANIEFDTSLREYYVTGTLENKISTLVIPDAYDDGINGVHKLTYIKNEKENVSLLTDNETVSKLYIGNNISTITEYFAYNSINIESVVFGRMVINIAGNAFGYCNNIKATEDPASNWADLTNKDLINITTDWKIAYFVGIAFDTTNGLLEEGGKDGSPEYIDTSTAEAATEAFQLKKIPTRVDGVKVGEVALKGYEPDVFPTTVNHHFIGWGLSSDPNDLTLVDFETQKVSTDHHITLYAKYLKGNVDDYITYYSSGKYYRISSKYAGTDETVVIPDIYDNGTNGVAKLSNCTVAFLQNNTVVKTLWIGNYCSSLYSDFARDSIVENAFFGINFTSISSHFFRNCSKLKNVILSKKITTIGVSAFYSCTILEDLIIPEGTTTIGEAAFESCKSLKNINIPDTVTELGRYCFHYCQSLSEIKIPNGVKSIKKMTFRTCTSLRSIILYEGLESIESSAFESCISLVNIDIPDSVKSIEELAFKSCSILENIEIPNGITKLEKEIFDSCSSLLNVKIPDSVVCIGQYAFHGCSSLEKIDLPAGVTSIESGAFYSCSALKNIEIPESVTAIEDYTFHSCNSLEKINIPKGVTSIGISAFNSCKSIKNIVIPKGVTELLSYTFYMCESLESVTIPDSVERISGHVFSYCKSLKNITIPNRVTIIETYTFSSCTSLKSITIPESVNYIKRYAFSNSINIENIYFVDYAGWESSYNESFSNPSSIDFSNSATNAEYLTDSYDSFYFRKI